MCARPSNLDRVTQLLEKRWSLKLACVVTLVVQDPSNLVDVFDATGPGKLKRAFDH
jgi:hypothetical protein